MGRPCNKAELDNFTSIPTPISGKKTRLKDLLVLSVSQNAQKGRSGDDLIHHLEKYVSISHRGSTSLCECNATCKIFGYVLLRNDQVLQLISKQGEHMCKYSHPLENHCFIRSSKENISGKYHAFLKIFYLERERTCEL